MKTCQAEVSFHAILKELDSRAVSRRLNGLKRLCALEQTRGLPRRIGPTLPSYDHVHTVASYGYDAPGVYSVARMVWAAHEAKAPSTLIIEHESIAHLNEAERAVAIVNRSMRVPLRLALGVEFKAPVTQDGIEARQFSTSLAACFGQGEAAWVVGVGAEDSPQLRRLVALFQRAKYQRAAEQLHRLNLHFGLRPKLELSQVVGDDGNITDRQLCLSVARANWPKAEGDALLEGTGAIRKLLNPGGPGYAPYPKFLPSFQQLITRLKKLGMTPVFTAQLRGRALAAHLPLLKRWGIAGLDVAGIEPDEPDAARAVREFISLAEKHQLALFGGSDYRGTGTGWRSRAAWMSHPLIRGTMTRFAKAP